MKNYFNFNSLLLPSWGTPTAQSPAFQINQFIAGNVRYRIDKNQTSITGRCNNSPAPSGFDNTKFNSQWHQTTTCLKTQTRKQKHPIRAIIQSQLQ